MGKGTEVSVLVKLTIKCHGHRGLILQEKPHEISLVQLEMLFESLMNILNCWLNLSKVCKVHGIGPSRKKDWNFFFPNANNTCSLQMAVDGKVKTMQKIEIFFIFILTQHVEQRSANMRCYYVHDSWKTYHKCCVLNSKTA